MDLPAITSLLFSRCGHCPLSMLFFFVYTVHKPKGNQMKVEPYLFFNGRCEEAIEFYKKALGAEVTMLLRFKDGPPASPESCAGGVVPDANSVMHANLRIGDTQLM